MPVLDKEVFPPLSSGTWWVQRAGKGSSNVKRKCAILLAALHALLCHLLALA